MSNPIKKLQGEDIDFVMSFQEGTDITITGFDMFDSITCQAWTSNYPVNDVEVTVTNETVIGSISASMTAKMYGQLMLFFTFTKSGKTYKTKINTDLFIDKQLP